MTPDTLFSIANLTALAGWIALAAKPYWRRADRFVVGVVVTLLSALYTWLLTTTFHLSDFASFGSLDGIYTLFSNKHALLAGWVHYLAFDLLTGLFIVVNAQKYRINHWLAMACGFFTFMAGPMGLLLYLLIRAVRSRKYFAENW
jgi:hypothetical protein